MFNVIAGHVAPRRRRIEAVCNCHAHPFPLRMAYGGRKWWDGLQVHVMYCPVSGVERYYVYDRNGYIIPVM